VNYFLPDRYIIRTDPVQDFEGESNRKDDCQREVYLEASKFAREMQLQTVIDIGTGSGWKLVTHFKDWPILDIMGIDLAPAVKILRERYPTHLWSTPDKLPEIAAMRKRMGSLPGTDLVICSDMIEHVLDPDETCETIKSLRPKWIVISTPDRDLVDRYFHPINKTFGPPRNRCHVREWNFHEFGRYMASHFDVVRHFLSNEKQCTQCAVMKIKEHPIMEIKQ
jgi:Methyltransferase domain